MAELRDQIRQLGGGSMKKAELVFALSERQLDDIMDKVAVFCKEIIGDDEPYDNSPKSRRSPLIKLRYRNELRATQRQRLKSRLTNP